MTRTRHFEFVALRGSARWPWRSPYHERERIRMPGLKPVSAEDLAGHVTLKPRAVQASASRREPGYARAPSGRFIDSIAGAAACRTLLA